MLQGGVYTCAMDEAGGDLTEYLGPIFDNLSRHALHPYELIVADGHIESLYSRDTFLLVCICVYFYY